MNSLATIVGAYRDKIEQRREAATPTPQVVTEPGIHKQPTIIPDYIQSLLDRGLDVIPCIPGTKQPLYANWQQRCPIEQIRQAIDEQRAFNLAVRGGGAAGLVVIDCEDESTFQFAVDWLSLNSIESYPVIRSASGHGYHIWLQCNDIPVDFSAGKLSAIFGPGEIRAGSGAYTLIPPSQAWSERGGGIGTYTFEEPWEMLDETDPVDWDEIIAFMMPASVPPLPFSSSDELSLPIPLPYQPAPPLVYTLLNILQTAPKGLPIPHPNGTREPYASRSEAEQAIISTLILCGWPYAEIARLFDDNQPGHYREISARSQAGYLKTSYRNALLNIIETPDRQPILAAYQWAFSPGWPLRSGLARLVYHHILLTAWRDARLDPIVPYSNLRQTTGASNGGLSAAIDQLEQAGLIRRLPGRALSGKPDRIEVFLDAEKTNNSHRGGIYTNLSPSLPKHLSYVAGYVHCALSDQAQSIKELSELVGNSRDTVASCLRELEKLGLAQQVHRYGWIAVDTTDALPVEGAVSEPLEKPQEAYSLPSGVLGILRQIGEAVAWLGVPGDLDTNDPVAVYVYVMSKTFGCNLSVNSLSSKRKEQLRGLALHMRDLQEAGQLSDSDLYHYIQWVAYRYRRVAKERGWPFVWINIVVSHKVLAQYIKEHPVRAPLKYGCEFKFIASS